MHSVISTDSRYSLSMARYKGRELWSALWWLFPLLGLLLWVVLDWETQPMRCPIKSLTGISCVGCGSLRSLHALLQGEFLLAFKLNPLAVVVFPLIGLMILSRWFDAFCGTELYGYFFRKKLSAKEIIALVLSSVILYLLKLYIGLT